MIPYGRQWIDDEDIAAVVEVLKSPFITQGPKIEEFERRLADFCGARFCVVFNSGTSALHAVYYALGLGKGDEFITSPITFVATANAGLFLGARPVFCDVEPDTGNLNPELLERLITPKTKLIVPVHYAGHPCDMKRIYSVARRYGVAVVEDACHSLGARYTGFPVGNCAYSDAVVFSFHPVKHITTGEGGAVLTNREDVYEKLVLFRNHGIRKFEDWWYEMEFLGFNYRMTDIQAALGISQLKKLGFFVKRRREIAAEYSNRFANNPFFDVPVEKEYAYHAYHLYVIRLKDSLVPLRKILFRKLRERGLGVQVHYIPVYWHPYYGRLGFSKGLCQVAEDFYSRVISIPLYPAMTQEDVEKVSRILMETLKELSS